MKKLSDEERFIKDCKQDSTIKYGLKCPNCGRYVYITVYTVDYMCGCHTVLYADSKVLNKAIVLYKGD